MRWSPVDYQQADVLANEAAEELLTRLPWLTCQPRTVLDLGCGTGEWGKRLQLHYPGATVIGIDGSEDMLGHARAQLDCCCADAACLPFADQQIDLIFANLLTPWCAGLPDLLREWRRVLRADGVLIMTMLGPDTLKEWPRELVSHVQVQRMDMHELGDELLLAGFADPVLDVNYYTITWRSLEKLCQELHSAGLITPVQYDDVTPLMPAAEGIWTITGEIVYAQAFAPAPPKEIPAAADGITRIPVARLREQLKDG